MEKQKEIYGIIYVIRNKVNNKLYIGQTTEKRGFNGRYHFKGSSIEKVYKYHKGCKDKNKSYNAHLLNSIEKYGFGAFEVDEEFDVAYSQEELNKLEYMYIEIYQCRNSDCGYNNRYGGNNGKLSEEHKNKISEGNSGENNGMYGRHGILNPFYGKHHTEETKRRISEANSGENSYWYGKTRSEEVRLKISENTKGRKGKTGLDNPKSKPVYCYELKEIRESGKQWEKELGIDSTNIFKCCDGVFSQIKGFHFRYATKDEIKNYDNKNNHVLTEKEILYIKIKSKIISGRAKAIWCEELKEVRIGSVQWGKELNLPNSNITKCCKGEHGTAGGYHFRYATEKETEDYITKLIEKELRKRDN